MVHILERVARQRPDEVALRDGPLQLGWAEVNETLNRATNALMSMLPGDGRRVAVFAENSAETLLIHLACLLAGVSSVPVNFHLTAAEVAYILSDSGAEALFVGPETAAVGLEAARLTPVSVVVGWRLADPAPAQDWGTWISEASPGEPAAGRIPRPNLLYTSGTTGRPKGADLPPTMWAGGATVAEHLDNLKSNPFARFGAHLVVGPMYHTGPLSGFRLLAVGVPVIILGRFDAEAILAAIDLWKAESSVMVPTHFIRLLQLPESVRRRYDVSSLQLVVHTGAACPVEVKKAMIEWWGPVLVEAYGATEVGTTCQITSEEWLLHPGSVGRAVPPFPLWPSMMVASPFRPTPRGCCTLPTARDGAWSITGTRKNRRPPTYAPVCSRWAKWDISTATGTCTSPTGSRTWCCPAGSTSIRPNPSGCCSSIPRYLTWRSSGYRTQRWARSLALVVPAAGSTPPTADELIAYCRQRLAHYKCPKAIDFVTTVGRTTMGEAGQ